MASSSTSPIHKSFKYDVFLSFRGEDTRKTFVDHLYQALKQKDIRTYKDDEEIKKGERSMMNSSDPFKTQNSTLLSYTQIKHLPDSICMLKHLQCLILDNCLLLEKLPEDLGQLEGLEELTLSSTKIKHLPDSIYMLKHLETLKLIDCPLFEKLPENIGQLRCFEKLPENISVTGI